MSEELNGESQNGNGLNQEIVDSALEILVARDAKASAAEAGLPYLNGQIIKRLTQIGVDAEPQSLVSTAAGTLVVTMEGAIEIMQMIREVARAAASKGKTQLVLDCGLTYAIMTKSVQGCAQAVKADGLVSKPQSKTKGKRFAIMPAAPPKVG